jgi:hypothetical protein
MKTHAPSPWSQAVTRRTFLRGATVSLALPWLESLPLRSLASGEVVKTPEAAKPPVRFGCIYFSNGVEPTHWWAKGNGADMELGNALEPIKPLCEEIVFLRGLYNQKAFAHKSPHLGRISNLLSGGWVSTDQNDIRCGKTMDQLMAQHLGERTPIP